MSHKQFMRQLETDLRRMKAVLTRIQKMPAPDKFYLLSRLKAKECAEQERQQAAKP